LTTNSNLHVDFELCAKDCGFDSLDLYYEKISSDEAVEKISVPMLSINSLDDLVVSSSGIPISKIEESDNIIQINVSGGGHIEYFTGLRGKQMVHIMLISVGI